MFAKIKDCIDKKLNEMHSTKIYLDVLEHIEKHKHLNINSKGVVKKVLFENTGSNFDADLIIRNLLGSGYLVTPHENNKGSLYITDEGRNYINEYYRFQMMVTTQKLEHLLSKSVTTFIAIVALAISFLSLFL